MEVYDNHEPLPRSLIDEIHVRQEELLFRATRYAQFAWLGLIYSSLGGRALGEVRARVSGDYEAQLVAHGLASVVGYVVHQVRESVQRGTCGALIADG